MKRFACANWTREWWHMTRTEMKLVSSAAVQVELEAIPDLDRRRRALELLAGMEMLDVDERSAAIVRSYLSHKLMPSEATGDAVHLALASLRGCDMLLTWNCRHLANSNKVAHIQTLNQRLGLKTPL